jgi:uncharacterized protein (DUF2062 family)
LYVVAIAWLYVVIIMAATEPSVVGAVLTFATYGLFPLGVFLWLVGTPQRRRLARRRADEEADGDNRENAGPDQ